MARWWNGRHAALRRPCPPRREGSSPSLVTAYFRGRLTVGRRTLTPPMLVRSQPPDLVALVVKRTSWLPPKEQVQVRLLAGVLTVVLGVCRRHATVRRSKMRFNSSRGC